MKKAIPLFFITMLAVIGCSVVTPAPEIVITGVEPPGLITTDITVTFENKNDVDAIVTRETILFRDDAGGSVTEVYDIHLYIGANSVVDLTHTFSALPALGAGRTMTCTYSGTDAYGYGKTFTVSTERICY